MAQHTQTAMVSLVLCSGAQLEVEVWIRGICWPPCKMQCVRCVPFILNMFSKHLALYLSGNVAKLKSVSDVPQVLPLQYCDVTTQSLPHQEHKCLFDPKSTSVSLASAGRISPCPTRALAVYGKASAASLPTSLSVFLLSMCFPCVCHGIEICLRLLLYKEKCYNTLLQASFRRK